jgi:three-Cys-motif partner protein
VSRQHSFFDERRAQSQIKTAIVLNYFFAWTKILLKRVNKIAYVDLFAGPGQYEDGTKSTPLLVLEYAIQDPTLRNVLVTIFNDRETAYIHSLEAASAALPGVTTLRYQPQFLNAEVGVDIANALTQKALIPTFYFIDPWGYKGLSLQLINAMLKDWGSECVLFFNYNRINPGLTNPTVRMRMNEIFGEDQATDLRTQLATLSPHDREQQIVHTTVEVLRGQKEPTCVTISVQIGRHCKDKSPSFFCYQAYSGLQHHERNYGQKELKTRAGRSLVQL